MKHTPEEVARFFHSEYERLAPAFDYETRRESAVPWEQLLDSNRKLMLAVTTSVMLTFFPDSLDIENEERSDRSDIRPED